MSRPDETETDTAFRDAEAWLAARGVERRPLTGPDAETDEADEATGDLEVELDLTDGETGDDRSPVSASEARRIATEMPAPLGIDPTLGETVAEGLPPLDDAIAAAVATIRRSTGAAPSSERRIARKLRERGLPEPVVTGALRRAREERLVDDDALAAALVAEWRAKGHAARRIRDDLRKRELDGDTIDRATASLDREDENAAAFGIARERAERMTHVAPETAYRRVAAFLARRGYPEGLARKAARDAVYDQRTAERTAGR